MSRLSVALLTPGTGSYHCGVCMRDNALAKELVRLGHDAIMLPMYLPLTLDEESASPNGRVFFGGVSTYLREKVSLLRKMPRWLDRILSNRLVLKMLAGTAAKTGGPEMAGMTISMLRGEDGNQADEVEQFVDWLETAFQGNKPDAVWLSTALQAGLARRIKARLRVPVIGFLQGEDTFLDGLGPQWSGVVWRLLAERMRDADLWIAPSTYFRDLMARRLYWSESEAASLVRCVPNGLSLEGYPTQPKTEREDAVKHVPTVGYLARMVQNKGLGLLVDAFLLLKKRNSVPGLRLRCAGSMTAYDEEYVRRLRDTIDRAGCAADVDWAPNLDRAQKIAFLCALDVFSVPATYSEAFGLYAIEAMAAGVPVVLPNASAFPEIVGITQGGILFDLAENNAKTTERLADALETLLRDPKAARAIGERGRQAIRDQFSITRLATRLAELTREKIDAFAVAA